MLSKRWIVNALLVVLIVGLSLVGVFFEPSATVEKKPAISQLTADQVDTIDIETGDLQLRLQRVNDGWDIESPINWPAQENNVRRLLSILKIEADALSDTADVDLAALGLQQPKASIRFNGIPLLFGATNNIGGRRYAMLDEKLYLLPDVHLVFVNQGLAGLIDRFDASRECREVTCLYNGVNWWLEKMTLDPREEIEIEVGDERGDLFL